MKSEELQDPPEVERGDREYERLVEEDLRELREAAEATKWLSDLRASLRKAEEKP